MAGACSQSMRRIVNTINHAAWPLVLLLAWWAQPAYPADVLVPLERIASNPAQMFIVSIGVERYADAFWPPLKWAAADARRVSNALGTGSNFKVKRYSLLNHEATLDNIHATLDAVAKAARPNDTVIFYVSTHGTLAQTGAGDLERVVVIYDTKKDQPLTTGLSQAVLNDWLEKIQARKKLMIFATCYSGEGKSRLPESIRAMLGTPKGKLISLAEVSEGSLILAAAAKNEVALENDQLQGDVYTHFILEALTAHDRNKDGMVSALEAHDYARDRTWEFTHGRQRPTANVRFIGDADIALYGRKSATGLPVLEAYDERLAGLRVQVNGRVKSELPTAFPLSENTNLVTIYAGSGAELGSYKIRAKPGDTVNLEEVMLHRPWTVGLSLRTAIWSSAAWDEVIGGDQTEQFMLTLGAQRGRWGVRFLVPTEVKMENEVRKALSSRSKLVGYGAGLDYRVATASWAWSLGAEVWSEELALNFSDSITSDAESFSASATSYVLGAGAHWRLWSDAWLQTSGGLRTGRWDFPRIGELNGDGYWLDLGVEYRFGGKGRTL